MLNVALVIRVVAIFALNVPLLGQASQDVRWGRRVVGSIPVQVGAARDPARLSVNEIIVSGTAVQDGGAVIAIWEPISQRFWWTYQLPDRSTDLDSIRADVVSEYHIIADSSRTVVFVAGGRSIGVRALSERFASMEAGLENVHKQLPQVIATVRSGELLFKNINLSRIMLDYFTAKGPGELGGPAGHGLILKSVRRSKDGWDMKVGLELVHGIVREETRAIKIDDSLSTATLADHT